MNLLDSLNVKITHNLFLQIAAMFKLGLHQYQYFCIGQYFPWHRNLPRAPIPLLIPLTISQYVIISFQDGDESKSQARL